MSQHNDADDYAGLPMADPPAEPIVIRHGRTYVILKQNGALAIRCTICGRVSYNLNDVEQVYCAHCKEFHEG